MPQSTTWDRRLYFPSEGRRAVDFLGYQRPARLTLDHRSRTSIFVTCKNTISVLACCSQFLNTNWTLKLNVYPKLNAFPSTVDFLSATETTKMYYRHLTDNRTGIPGTSLSKCNIWHIRLMQL
jgi:hypothetical protein